MSILVELFCKHKYLSHAKEEFNYDEIELVKGTEYWPIPIKQTVSYTAFIEILICEKCGKIKKIEY